MKSYLIITFLYIAAFFSTSCLNETTDTTQSAPKLRTFQESPPTLTNERPRIHRLTSKGTFALIDSTPSLKVMENFNSLK